jgi:hypothetical protein
MSKLVDDLAKRDAAQFEALLRGRPDLLELPRRTLAALAGRAGSENSLKRALDRLDTAHLAALTAVALRKAPVSTDDISAALGRPADALLQRLWELALLFGTSTRWQMPGALPGLLIDRWNGPDMALLNPHVAQFAASPQTLTDLLAQAPEAAHQAVAAMLANSVVPKRPAANVRTHPTLRGIAWLEEHRIVFPIGTDRVAMPAELVTLLRPDGRLPNRVVQLDPPRRGHLVAQRPVDEAGAQAGMLAIEMLASIGRSWAANPPATVVTGGLPMRDLNRIAAEFSVTPEQARVLLLAAGSAGMFGTIRNDGPLFQSFLVPTDDFHKWLLLGPESRWAVLAHAWLQMLHRTQPAPGKQRLRNPLGPDDHDWSARETRELVLGICMDPDHAPQPALDPGTAVAHSLDDVLDLVSWRAPRQYDTQRMLAVGTVLAEAQWLGVMAAGAVTSAGAALLSGMGPAGSLKALVELSSGAAAALRPLLAQPVDSVIVQADLTVVVPGPPAPELGAFLDAATTVESHGVARVHRINTASLRTAMARGWTGPKLVRAFRRWSSTGVPQPLEVLISDVARDYARLRSGPAMAYLRSDDQAHLAQILADPKLADLGLFQLAPTVLASSTDHPTLMAALAKRGYHPVTESPKGTVSAPKAHRGVRVVGDTPPWAGAPGATQIHQVAAALCAQAQPAEPAQPAQPPRVTETIAVADLPVIRTAILAAIAAQQRMRITYVQASGQVVVDVVTPTAVVAGVVQALRGVDAVVSVPLARVLDARDV